MALTPLQKLARSAVRAKELDAFVAAKRSSFTPETVAELKEEVDRLVKTDLTKAEPLARATHRIGEILGDEVSLAYGEAALAQAHHYSGRLGLAEPLYRSAIERLRASRRRVEAAAIELQLVSLYYRQNDSKRALATARSARRVLRRAESWTLLGQLETNVGNVYYSALGQYRTALRYYDRAREIFERLGDDASLAVAEFNRANVLLELDRPNDALELYEKSERINLSEGRAMFASQCSYQLAFALATVGRYADALKRYYRARDRFREVGDRVSAAWCGLYLAELHHRLNVLDEAISLVDEALREFTELDCHDAETARAHLLKAQLHEKRRDLSASEVEIQHATAIYSALQLKVLSADAMLAKAALNLANGSALEADRLATEAESVYRQSRLPGRTAYARIVRAEARRALGQYGAALRFARNAARAAARCGDPWLESRAETLVGEIELERGRTREGVAALERAVSNIESLRLRLRPGEARAAFLTDKLSPYERLVEFNLRRGGELGLREAFRYVEMAKSRTLADLMAQHLGATSIEDFTGRDARVREQLSRRIQELSWYTARIEGHHQKGDTRNARLDTHLRRQLARCESELASLFRRLEVEDSHLASLLTAEPVGLEDISSELADDEAAVEFFVIGDRVSAFVITRDGATAYSDIADLESIDRLASGFRFQVEKFALGSGYAKTHGTALRHCADNHLESLYDALFAPLEERIEGRRLVLIPHGLLHYVPLHALKRPDGRYLIETTEITYSPSATVHRLCARRPAPNGTHGMLAVGLGDERTPHISAEIAALEKLFPNSVLLEGERASKAAFLESAPRYRFLHLATHGYFRQDNPLFSSVKLVDGPLNFYDVFDLSLDAELVTLSACNTGLNKLAPGDELSGLMRGFLYAGAPSLLVSLWAVNDESTSRLMGSFYGHVQAGETKRAALRLAQLEALEQYGHPYYWAPFILMGKP